MMRRLLILGAALLAFSAALTAPAAAQRIGRTITIDGSMSDWTAAPSILTNPGQFSTDCQGGEACERDVLQSTGRDLKFFSYTWDQNFLYFYVERYSSTSNTTNWLFYLDENADGLMQTGERIFRVDWQGSNRTTTAYVCTYTQVAAGGDPIRGDGFTMPGGGGNCTTIYSSVVAGSATGLEMESRVAWSQLGMTGPQNIGFHISSSRGMNLPSHVEDNMGGPTGGQLFPPDLAVSMSTGGTQVGFQQTLDLTVTLTNLYFGSYSDIGIDVSLPPEVDVVSHTAPAGSSFVDTDGDGRPDRWNISALAAQEQRQLQIQVRGGALPQGTGVSAAAQLVAWTGTDADASNNVASVDFTVQPSPQLSITNTASSGTARPGEVVQYAVLVANPAHAPAVQVVATASLDANVMFAVDTFGAGVPFQVIDGTPAAGVTPAAAQYSSDGGVTWTYVPASGGGGAPPGFDANVTNWRIPMSGTMNSHGASFEVLYRVRVR